MHSCIYFYAEPGYYEDGKFGIRIEDIVQIVPANVKSDFAGRGALTFKTITMCPIQTKLIDAHLLSEKEVCELYFMEDQNIFFSHSSRNYVFVLSSTEKLPECLS